MPAIRHPIVRTGFFIGGPLALLWVAILVIGQRERGPAWPSLGSVVHVAGRPATWDDVHARRAAISFVFDGHHRGAPMPDVEVPQYAYRIHAGGRERAVLIQAERDADGKPIFGLRGLADGTPVACDPSEVQLLGRRFNSRSEGRGL